MTQPTPDRARETIARAQRLLELGRKLDEIWSGARQRVLSEHATLVAPRDPVTAQVDLSDESPEQQPLIEALDRWMALDAARRPLAGLSERVLPVLDEELPGVELLTSGLRWAFTGAERREVTLRSWERVAQVVGWADKNDVAQRVEDALAASPPTPDVATRHLALTEVVGVRLDHAAVTGDAAGVDAQLLDETGLGLELRGYQRFAVKAALHHRRLLVADEPGLGASVQAAGLLSHLGDGHHLVVASRGQQTAWARAIAEHTELPVFQLLDEQAASLWRSGGGVGLVTHDNMPADSIELKALVIDDAHYLRERSGRRATAVAELAERSRYVLLLTSDPTFRVSGPSLRRTASDVPYELPRQTRVTTWLDPTPSDLAAHATALLAGNFSQARRAGFATGDPMESAKSARVIETVNTARKNELKCAVTSHFLGVLTTCVHALRESGFRALGPITASTPVSERNRAIEEFVRGDSSAVLVTQLFEDGLRLDADLAAHLDVTVVTEPPTEAVDVPGGLVYTLALVGTIDESIVAAEGEGESEASLGRRLIATRRRG